MNGRVVKQWEGFNSSAGGPVRILPDGEVIGAAGARPGHQESLQLVQKDFTGAQRWALLGNDQIEGDGGAKARSLRQHHDWQRADYPAGYFSPESRPASTGAATLVLSHAARTLPAVSDLPLEDDHWLHVNSATYVGPNRWFDAGDKRFDPQNIIISSRQASLLAIIARDGHVVWRMGPDFRESPQLMRIGQIIGQHHAHLIPKGLPGAGNLLLFDNGGSSGYGFDTPIARNGYGGLARANSRVLEIDPVKLELVWSYAPAAGFFGTNISGAQRLPNGNTLITEGPSGRVFEVTAQRKIAWEYINPATGPGGNAVYRAYRLPYDWIPQLPRPAEQAVVPPGPPGFHSP